MGTSQRVSRGFHRVGLFLGAVTLAIGFTYSGYRAWETDFCERLGDSSPSRSRLDPSRYLDTPGLGLFGSPPPTVDQSQESREKQVAVYDLERFEKELKAKPSSPTQPSNAQQGRLVTLYDPGCSNWPALGRLWVTIFGAIILYAFIRAIGWVIGGFAAS